MKKQTNSSPHWFYNKEKRAPTIHFSGANGFPVASYKSFFKPFEGLNDICAVDSRATWLPRQDPPKNFGMHGFADDLINSVKFNHKKSVIGMGHSQGCQSTLIAALKAPDLFSKLIIIEPASLPNPYIDVIYRKIPKPLLFKLFPFMRGSEMRKSVWESRQAFFEKYQSHPTFKHFTNQALHDYSEHGLFENENGEFELVFDPIWESYIFRKIEFVWKFLRKIEHPTLLIRAQNSTLYTSEQFKKNNASLPSHIDTIEIADTHHLLPFEQPQILFNEIKHWLHQG